MKKASDVFSGVLKAVKAKRVLLIILAVFLLIGFISYWSYQRTMQKLLDGGILSGTSVSSIAADTTKEDVTEEETTEAEPATQVSDNMGFALPSEGEIINEFSDGELVKSKTLGYWITHDGVDIQAEDGADVLSAGEGEVIDIYDDTRWGVCIEIDHKNGVFSYYFGLSEDIEVSVGDLVVTGQRIGFVGDTAEIESKEETHLHFAMKQNGEWINPIEYIEENS